MGISLLVRQSVCPSDIAYPERIFIAPICLILYTQDHKGCKFEGPKLRSYQTYV